MLGENLLMVGEDLKFGLSSRLTSARAQLIFPPHSPPRFFFPKDFFSFQFLLVQSHMQFQVMTCGPGPLF